MKNLLKTLNTLIFISTFIATLVHCSKSQFDKTGGHNPGSNFMEEADGFTYTEPYKDDIVWSQALNNIYIVISKDCVKGLVSNADDPVVEEKIRQLSELISQAGTGENSQYNTATLEVRYEDNTSQTFNVDINQFENNPSNHHRIKEFFDNIRSEIHRKGLISCANSGK